MFTRKLIHFYFCIHTCIVIFSCAPEAPLSNPLDPGLNDSQKKASIVGAVFTFYQPASPLSNVSVQLLPAGAIKFTSREGTFSFNNLSPGVYQLVAEKDNYQRDTIEVSISSAQIQRQVDFFLNAIPEIKGTTFYSEHIDQWWPGETYHAIFTLIVGDFDGTADIDSAAIFVPALNFSRPFKATTRPDSFSVDIENLDLPQENLQHLIEQESFIFLQDKNGAVTTGGPFFLRRIIEEAPQPLSPSNLQVAPPFPVLEWQVINLPFQFNYVVQVFRITAGFPVLIHTSAEIPVEQLTYNFPDSLNSGAYFWTSGVRDNLNNFSRSKEASFMVP